MEEEEGKEQVNSSMMSALRGVCVLESQVVRLYREECGKRAPRATPNCASGRPSGRGLVPHGRSFSYGGAREPLSGM